MKIFYAANKGYASYLQLKRFLDVNVDHEVRVAGYNGYLHDIPADYTLDALGDFYGKERYSPILSKTFERYRDEIGTYRPDLIISDLDFYTSYAAMDLDIPYWIVSSFLLFFALPKRIKDALGVARNYRYVLFQNKAFHRYPLQIANASRRLVYSCLADVPNRPDLLDGFEWVRPYYEHSVIEGEPSFLANFSKTDKQSVEYLRHLGDVNLYSTSPYELYEGIRHRSHDDSTYAQDLNACYLMFSRGETSFVADAFYNKKYTLLLPDYENNDTILNSRVVEYFGIGERIHSKKSFEQINSLVSKEINIEISPAPNVGYLHEYIQ